jgi:hypothetical protein
MIVLCRNLAVLAVGALAGLTAGACEGAKAAAPATLPPTTRTPATTTTVPATSPPAPAAPSTTVYVASAPQTSPDAAAGRLVAAWAAGDRAGAAGVATPGAVAALFAVPYPAGYIQARGCTDPSVNPGTCTYRNTRTDGIYEIGVAGGRGGWYVASVTVET